MRSRVVIYFDGVTTAIGPVYDAEWKAWEAIEAWLRVYRCQSYASFTVLMVDQPEEADSPMQQIDRTPDKEF